MLVSDAGSITTRDYLRRKICGETEDLRKNSVTALTFTTIENNP